MMSATSLFAQKFGRISSEEIIAVMPETKEMRTNMQAYVKNLQDEMEALQVEYNNKLQEFQKRLRNLFGGRARHEEQGSGIDHDPHPWCKFEQVARGNIQKNSTNCWHLFTKRPKRLSTRLPLWAIISLCSIRQGSLAYFDAAALTDIAPEVRKELRNFRDRNACSQLIRHSAEKARFDCRNALFVYSFNRMNNARFCSSGERYCSYNRRYSGFSLRFEARSNCCAGLLHTVPILYLFVRKGITIAEETASNTRSRGRWHRRPHRKDRYVHRTGDSAHIEQMGKVIDRIARKCRRACEFARLSAVGFDSRTRTPLGEPLDQLARHLVASGKEREYRPVCVVSHAMIILRGVFTKTCIARTQPIDILRKPIAQRFHLFSKVSSAFEHRSSIDRFERTNRYQTPLQDVSPPLRPGTI